MYRSPRVLSIPALATLAAIFLVPTIYPRGQNQEPEKVLKQPATPPTVIYYGVTACTKCHDKPDKKNPPILCRCNEFPIWEEQDKHGLAMKNLETDRARRMATLLQIADVTKEKRCVTCHGVWVSPAEEKQKRIHKSFNPAEGVNCCACHGAYADWVDLHGGLRSDEWRGLTRKQKQDWYGMQDLWDPVKRTQLCVSCHVGNIDQEKFVTHEMYAAGHPPLPGIEMVTFSEVMPRHWETWLEKQERLTTMNQDIKKYYPEFDPEAAKFERSELVLVGGAAALLESLKLVAYQARHAPDANDPDDRMLDLALFDCYACHHELKNPGWRAGRGYRGGKPGRPQLQPWPTALLRAGLRSVDRKEDVLTHALKPLFDEFDRQPFGDCKKVEEAGRQAMAALDRIIKDLKKPMDRARANRLLTAIASVAEEGYPDYDTARQLAWGYLAICREIKKKDTPEALLGLDKVLQLSLPATRKQELETSLPRALRMRAEYDPEAFKREFRKLVTETSKPQP